MHLICERDALAGALPFILKRLKVGAGAPDRVLLTAAAPTLRLTGHSLDASAVVEIPADIKEIGSVSVAGEAFGRLIKNISEGSQLFIETDVGTMKLRASRARYTLPTLPASEFPVALNPSDPSLFTLDALAVKRLFGIHHSVIGVTKGREYLQGIYLHHVSDGVLSSVATDGHRLLRTEIASDVKLSEPIIIPKEACDDIRVIAANGAEFSCPHDILSVSTNGRTFATKLIDGTFPDYQRIIPAADGPFIEVNFAEFCGALSRLDLLTQDRSFIRFSWDDDAATLTATNSSGAGSGEESIACQANDVVAGTVSVWPAKFRQMISVLGAERLRFFFGDVKAPFRIVDPDALDLIAVQAPCWQGGA